MATKPLVISDATIQLTVTGGTGYDFRRREIGGVWSSVTSNKICSIKPWHGGWTDEEITCEGKGACLHRVTFLQHHGTRWNNVECPKMKRVQVKSEDTQWRWRAAARKYRREKFAGILAHWVSELRERERVINVEKVRYLCCWDITVEGRCGTCHGEETFRKV